MRQQLWVAYVHLRNLQGCQIGLVAVLGSLGL